MNPKRRPKDLLSPFILVGIIFLAANAAIAQEIDAEAPPAQIQDAGLEMKIQVGKDEYVIPAPTNEDQSLYQTMSPTDQNRFQRNRRTFIVQLSRALQMMKYGFGIGGIVKDHVKYFLEKRREAKLDALMQSQPIGVREDYETARSRAQGEANNDSDPANKTLRERSKEAVSGMLQSMDKTLWKQAPIFANANEFGAMGAIGLEALGGIQNKGGWGLLVDAGVSVGYNQENKAVVVQVFRDFEKFKSTAMQAVALGGVVYKAGIYVANQRPGVLQHDGISFYPPMAPAFTSVSQDNMMTGFSSGLTWPPSPIGDMLTYTNSLNQNMLLRISISSLYKGFIRIETGAAADLKALLIDSPRNLLQKLFGKSNPVDSLVCQSALSR